MRNKIYKYRLHLIAFVLALIIGGVTSAYLGQDLNWDLLNYHHYSAYALIHHRIAYDIAPAQHQSYGNPLLDLPAYVLFTHLKPILAGAILGAIQGINIWMVFEIALVLLKKVGLKKRLTIIVAFSIALISFFGAANISEVGNTMGDNLTSIVILTALWLLLTSFDKSKAPANAQKLRIIAYFIAGLAAGLKLTNAGYVVALFLGGFLVEGTTLEKIKTSIFHGISIIGGMLIASGFWYWKMWHMFKNPIFPYYNTLFKSGYYFDINFVDTRWFPTTWVHKIFYPFVFARTQNQAAEIPFRDPRIAVMFVLIVVSVIVWLSRNTLKGAKLRSTRLDKQQVIFWIFILVSYITWQKQFSYYRYLLPIEMISLLAISLLIYGLFKSLKNTATSIIFIVLTVITVFTIPINWGRIPWQHSYLGVNLPKSPAVGANSTVLIAGYNPFSFIVPSLPPSARVVRVQSNMANPTTNQPPSSIALIRRTINEDKYNNNKFYALESKDEQATQASALKVYGFVNNQCSNIGTYANAYVFKGKMQFVICSLRNVNE